jgi:hypothetical protein
MYSICLWFGYTSRPTTVLSKFSTISFIFQHIAFSWSIGMFLSCKNLINIMKGVLVSFGIVSAMSIVILFTTNVPKRIKSNKIIQVIVVIGLSCFIILFNFFLNGNKVEVKPFEILIVTGTNLFMIFTAIEFYNLFKKKKKNYLKSIHHLLINIINLMVVK